MVVMFRPTWFSSITYTDLGLTMKEVWISREKVDGVKIRTVYFFSIFT